MLAAVGVFSARMCANCIVTSHSWLLIPCTKQGAALPAKGSQLRIG